MARADDVVQEPDTLDAVGRPVFLRSQGQGMMLFVEARQGASRLEDLTYDPIGLVPGIEIIASQPLGDGSPAVCDYDPPLIGGVPGVDPLAFDDSSAVRDAVADLGCRFNDGTGAPRGRNANNACTRDAGALYSFIDPESDLQYCLPIAKAWAFPVGDTIVAARVRDLAGNVSAVSEIVIRVAGDQPFDCSLGLGERDFLPQAPASGLVVNEQGTVSLDALVDRGAAPVRRTGRGRRRPRPQPARGRDPRHPARPTAKRSACASARAAATACSTAATATPQDVRAIANSETERTTVDSGLGVPAGTGSASLRLPVSFLRLPSGSAPDDCADAEFGGNLNDALTTATATAEVIDGSGATIASLVRVGAPFDCARWQTGGEQPALVLPIPTTDPEAGAVAAALVLAE